MGTIRLLDERGTSAVEYVICVGLVAVAALGAWATLGESVAVQARCVATAIGGGEGCEVGGGAIPAGAATAALTSAPSSDGSLAGAAAAALTAHADGEDGEPTASASPSGTSIYLPLIASAPAPAADAPTGDVPQGDVPPSDAAAVEETEDGWDFAGGFVYGFVDQGVDTVVGVVQLALEVTPIYQGARQAYEWIVDPTGKWEESVYATTHPIETIQNRVDDALAMPGAFWNGLTTIAADTVDTWFHGSLSERGELAGRLSFEVASLILPAAEAKAGRAADAAADAARAAELAGMTDDVAYYMRAAASAEQAGKLAYASQFAELAGDLGEAARLAAAAGDYARASLLAERMGDVVSAIDYAKIAGDYTRAASLAEGADLLASAGQYTLRVQAGRLVEVGGTATPAQASWLADRLSWLPEDVLAKLEQQGSRVTISVGNVTDALPELRGVQPRGWPAGSTWADVPGVYTGATNQAVVAVTGEGEIVFFAESGSAQLLYHEVGHAVDLGSATRVITANDSAFVAAYEATPFDALNDAYYMQPGAAGLQEAFAESFALYYSQPELLAEQWPALYEYWANNPLAIP